jgi:4-alpha-glucanotransferase
MTDALHDLARTAGLADTWTDYRGERRRVPDASLEAILAALDLPAGSQGDIAGSLDRIDARRRVRPPLVTAVAEHAVQLVGNAGRARLVLETGERMEVVLTAWGEQAVTFQAPEQIGYHRLELDDEAITLAVAPPRALTVADLTVGRRAWGVAVQLYSLNDGGDFGDFADLARFAVRLGQYGADAVAVSPTHALFTADLDRYAPYGPSTRLFLNPLYAATAQQRAAVAADLIDWPAGAARKLQALRADFAALQDRSGLAAFTRAGGEPLLSHARFEALDARFRPQGFTHWRDWPDGCGDARSAAVQALAADDPSVEFHLFLQWRAAEGARAAQEATEAAGMAVGVIADLAVGMDGAGSHAWSRPTDVLGGVSIGAPPDLLAQEGQTWGLTTFSPTALRERAYEPFLATLRAALRHAGGVRIDHAIGLQHMWVTPDGASAADGAYLTYPFEDLLRLIALESHRHGAVVIGEDLGTVPPGFRGRTTEAGLAGMRVLWFERTDTGAFQSPASWDRQAVAMTTTHDLPSVAGWWRGRDIDWREVLGLDPDPETSRRERRRDAGLLWQAMAGGAEPAPDQTEPVVDAALAHVAGSACDLALVAMEDVLGEVEQPNLPGLSDPHPNWRRRLPHGNGFDRPQTPARLMALDRARKATS